MIQCLVVIIDYLTLIISFQSKYLALITYDTYMICFLEYRVRLWTVVQLQLALNFLPKQPFPRTLCCSPCAEHEHDHDHERRPSRHEVPAEVRNANLRVGQASGRQDLTPQSTSSHYSISLHPHAR